MRVACEALIHAAVVRPIVVLAGMIDAASEVAKVVSTAADHLAGQSRRRSAGVETAPWS